MSLLRCAPQDNSRHNNVCTPCNGIKGSLLNGRHLRRKSLVNEPVPKNSKGYKHRLELLQVFTRTVAYLALKRRPCTYAWCVLMILCINCRWGIPIVTWASHHLFRHPFFLYASSSIPSHVDTWVQFPASSCLTTSHEKHVLDHFLLLWILSWKPWSTTHIWLFIYISSYSA